jgi:hypothetical protein
VLLKHVLAFAITNVECVRKQPPIQHGMIFGSIFGFVDLFSCCKGINFARFRKIIHLLFLPNGIITQIFGINEKIDLQILHKRNVRYLQINFSNVHNA